LSDPLITFTSYDEDWVWLRSERRAAPPESPQGRSSWPVLSLGGDVQIRDTDGAVLFPEPIVRRAYRVDPGEVVERANPARGLRLYVFALARSLLRLRTEGFGSLGQAPDTHAYVERSSAAVIHFLRLGDSVRISAQLPPVPDEAMPVLTSTVEELFRAIDRFVHDVCLATRRHAPEALDWVALEPIRECCSEAK
jgi:hypothetical protein